MKKRKKLRSKLLSFSLAVIMIIGTLTGIVPGTSIKANAETATGVWSSGINYSYDTATGVLTLTGNGSTNVDSSTVVFNEREHPPKINEPFSNISRIVISEGITSIGNYAFANWRNGFFRNNLTIEIPSTVTSIGNWAFSSITMGSVSVIMNARPDNITTFYTNAFNGSSNGEFITPYASEWKDSNKCSYDSTNNRITFDNTYKGIFTLSGVTYTVTYKVINGTWSDDSTTDKTETVQSGAKPASVPTGMKAGSGYTGGSWDTNPADATITGATTFTYTFTTKQAATVTKAPTAKNPTYNGQAQALVEAGTAEGGTMVYALGENATTAPTDNLYTTSIPAATNAGTYYVWYMVKGDSNHNDSKPECVEVTINKKEETTEAPSSYKNEWVKGQWYDANGKTGYKPQGQWKKNSTGWWYVDEAGWYPTNMWQKIDGKWYFFDDIGYMVTNAYAGKWSPYSEGYWWVGEDGAWDGSEPGVWRLSGTKWWFKDSTGWYAKGKSYNIGGNDYEFDADGWWIEK